MVRRENVDQSKLVLIYNGVATSPFETALSRRKSLRRKYGIRDDEQVLVTVANLIPYKGHFDLILAAREVCNRFPRVQFLLAGEDRGIQDGLERKVRELGLQRSVRFLGRRDDIPGLLAAGDISVLPSHEEGFSNVILESMAAGLPVVATDVGGNGEAVQDGVTGWLTPPGDPSALAEKIIDLLEDPVRARAWGRAGRERIGRMFTVERMVEAHLQLYGARDFSQENRG